MVERCIGMDPKNLRGSTLPCIASFPRCRSGSIYFQRAYEYGSSPACPKCQSLQFHASVVGPLHPHERMFPIGAQRRHNTTAHQTIESFVTCSTRTPRYVEESIRSCLERPHKLACLSPPPNLFLDE